jgi:nuclear pore complex protein Nup188
MYHPALGQDEHHPCIDLAKNLLPSIVDAKLVSTLLTSFKSRTQQSLPDSVRCSPRHSAFWSKQLIREQKALLELIFLVYYMRLSPDGPGYKLIIDTIRETSWGQSQESSGFFDAETKVMVKELGDILAILAVEGLSLETAMEEEYSIPEPSAQQLSKSHLYHPSHLQAVNESIEALVNLDSRRASPVLIAWAFILSKITNSLVERGVPEIYHAFATQSLHVEASMSTYNRSVTSSSPQPLFQLYISHALSSTSSLFDSLLSTLSSPLFGSPTTTSDPNVLGYLLVLRSVIVCLPLIFRLSYLTSDQYASLLKVVATLYGNRAAAPLCARFWVGNGLDLEYDRGAEAVGEDEIVDLAKARFPVQFGGFIKVVKAMCYGVTGLLTSSDNGEHELALSNEDEDLSHRLAETSYAYLANLTTLTHIVPPSPALVPLPYEIVTDPDPANISYRAARSIPISKSILIPVGTRGRLLSPPGSNPVIISWDIEWSAWKLFGDILDDFAGEKEITSDVFGGEVKTAGLPVVWDSEEGKVEDITNVLELFRIATANKAALGRDFGSHLSPSNDPKFVQTLFKILERSLSTQQPSTPRLVSSLLGLISCLLPTFPGAIWSFLRGSTLIFPRISASSAWRRDTTRHAILAAEKVNGSYPITTSMISLVKALVVEEQLSAVTLAPDYGILKQEVLLRALSWIRDDVWSGHLSWRYVELCEKFEMSRKIIELYALVLNEVELIPGTSRGKFTPTISLVVDILLVKSTVSTLSPLLSPIAGGPATIISLRRSARHHAAQSAEDLVQSSLSLAQRSIQLRRRINATPTSLLERLLFSHGSPEGMTSASRMDLSLIGSLTQYMVSPLNPKLSIIAAQVLTLLCIGSNELGSTLPSLMSLIGGSEKSEILAVEMLNIVSDPQGNENLQVALWDLVSGILVQSD